MSNFSEFRTPNDVNRYWSRVYKQDGCWLWLGPRIKKSPRLEKGVFKFGKNQQYTAVSSRVAWFLEHGDPGDLLVLHHCDNPVCVNPGHLWLGTVQDNNADMSKKGRRHTSKHYSAPEENYSLFRESIKKIAEMRQFLGQNFANNQKHRNV